MTSGTLVGVRIALLQGSYGQTVKVALLLNYFVIYVTGVKNCETSKLTVSYIV